MNAGHARFKYGVAYSREELVVSKFFVFTAKSICCRKHGKCQTYGNFNSPQKNRYSAHPDWGSNDVYTAARLYTERNVRNGEGRVANSQNTEEYYIRRLAAFGLFPLINGKLFNCDLLNQIVACSK